MKQPEPEPDPVIAGWEKLRRRRRVRELQEGIEACYGGGDLCPALSDRDLTYQLREFDWAGMTSARAEARVGLEWMIEGARSPAVGWSRQLLLPIKYRSVLAWFLKRSGYLPLCGCGWRCIAPGTGCRHHRARRPVTAYQSEDRLIFIEARNRPVELFVNAADDFWRSYEVFAEEAWHRILQDRPIVTSIRRARTKGNPPAYGLADAMVKLQFAHLRSKTT
jgi:hypothetical protein